jgi:hypothetical protein
MPKIEVKGLRGLRGIDYSNPKDIEWLDRQKKAGIVTNNWADSDINKLYRNKQFIDRFGKDAFKAMQYDEDARNALYRSAVIDDAFKERFNPFFENGPNKKGADGILYDPNKGMGSDYFKYYNSLSDDAKEELLNSDYRSISELKEEQEEATKKRHSAKNLVAHSYAPAFGGGGLQLMAEQEAHDTFDKKHNDAILQRIYSEDNKKKAALLTNKVQEVYDGYYKNLKGDELNKAFQEAIHPKKGTGQAYVLSAYFDKGKSTEDETEDFSDENKREFLAKKRVYDAALGEEVGHDALNDEYKQYISDHTGFWKYQGLLARDIGIGAAAYTADKWNSMRRVSLIGQDANVFVTEKGEIVPTEDVKFNGKTPYYTDKEGNKIEVHTENRSLLNLDDLGKDETGKDRGWFNNAQFWNDAEQYGTMDEEEIAKYKETGYSPHKVVYAPGEETDIYYETAKMMQFGLVDAAENLLPLGAEMKGLNLLLKASKYAGAAGKAMTALGKTMYYTGKYSRSIVNPITSATGIGYAYERGKFGEEYQGNMQKVEQTVEDRAQKEVYNAYNTNPKYKKEFDNLVNKEYQNLLNQYKQKKADRKNNDSNTPIIDDSDTPEVQNMLKQQAQSKIAYEKAREWSDAFKKTDAYHQALTEAAEDATDGALIAGVTDAAKYAVVNFGWRSFLFKTPKELATSAAKKMVSDEVKEVTDISGKKVLTSNYDFGTFKGRMKQFGKAAGTSFWNGAWTNFTDEMQSAGGARVNEDKLNNYLNGLYNGKAEGTTYNVIDGIGSYFLGALGNIGETNTWKAGLVGGLGTWSSMAPNIPAILSTPNFRETWAKASFGERANMVISNGLLNEYYSRKQGQKELKQKVDLINEVLKKSDDFDALNKLTTTSLASMDITNPEDQKVIHALKAIQSIAALQQLTSDETLDLVGQQSTPFNTAMETVEKLLDPSKLTEKEKKEYLSQYYAENKSISQSEANDNKVLQELQERASQLQNAVTDYNNVQATIEEIERSKGVTLSEEVKNRLVYNSTLNNFLKDRVESLERSISGMSSTDREDRIEAKGNVPAQQHYVRTLEKDIEGIEKEHSKEETKRDEAKQKFEEYKEDHPSDTTSDEYEKLEGAYRSSQAQVEFLEELKRNITLERDRYVDKETGEVKISTEVISAHDILNMSPRDRARMLDRANYNLYTDAQKAEIDKAIKELNDKDPSLLQAVQDVNRLSSLYEANKRAYSRIVNDPVAASYQLDAEREQQRIDAANWSNYNRAVNVAHVLNYQLRNAKGTTDAEKTAYRNAVKKGVYINLRQAHPTFIQYLIDNDVNLQLESVRSELEKALQWSEATTDMNSVIDTMGLDEEAKKNFTTNLDKLLQDGETKEDILGILGAISKSDIKDIDYKANFVNLLNGLEELWGQKAATNTLSKEERQAALDKSREEAAKKEAELKEKEAHIRRVQEAKDKYGSREPIKNTYTSKAGNTTEGKYTFSTNEDGNTTVSFEGHVPAKFKISNEDVGLSVDELIGDKSSFSSEENYNDVADAAKKGEIIINEAFIDEFGNITIDTNQGITIEGEAAKKVFDKLFNQQKEEVKTPTEEEKQKGEEAALHGITDKDADTSNDREAELAANGLNEKDLKTNNEKTLTPEEIEKAVNEGEEALESPTLEEQAAEDTSGKVVKSSAPLPLAPVEDKTVSSTEDNVPLLGNSIYGYDLSALIGPEKAIVQRTGSYFDWMNSFGVKLQEIIDKELGKIAKLNPDLVPLRVKIEKNATHDDAVQDLTFWAVKYTDAVAKIHNEEFGGVVDTNDGRYLIVGTMGFPRGSKNTTYLAEHTRAKTDAYKYFKDNPTERFYVSTDRTTKIQDISAGRLVKRLATDTEVQTRSISEIVNDADRNPRGLKIDELKWLILGDEFVLTVNVTDRNTVYSPRDGVSLPGSLFLLIEGANGNYVPVYMNPVRFGELRDGALLNSINESIQGLASTDLNTRLRAKTELLQIFNLNKDGDWLLVGDLQHPTITIQKNGVNVETIVIGPDAGFTEVRDAILRMNPRINITTSVLSNATSLEQYSEAGALDTDIASLTLANANYNVYPIDANGKPIIKESNNNPIPPIEIRSDLMKAQEKQSSEVFGKVTYRRGEDNVWRDTANKPVTDSRLIAQLNYSNLIRTRGLTPVRVVGRDEIFIINNDVNNPIAVIRRGQAIIPMSREASLKSINDANAKAAEEARQQRVKEEADKDNEKGLTEEEVQKATNEGQDVDIPKSGQTLTPEQLAAQYEGNFDAPAEGEKAPENTEGETPIEGTKGSTDNSTNENINSTGTKSLAELQAEKKYTTAKSIITSKEYGKRVRDILRSKFPGVPMSELEKTLEEHGISTTNIIDVENWIKLIVECR